MGEEDASRSPHVMGDFFMYKDRFNTRRMVTLALFCALAYAVTFVFRIKVSFLTFDAKDAIICIAAMIFGPVPSVMISLVVSVIEMITVSDTGFWGMIMNFASTAMFAALAGGIYKHFRTVRSAIAGLAASVVAMTALMLIMNILITPIYMNVNVDTVMKMIPTLLLPFNLTKAILNAAIVMILYKPVSSALKKAHVLPSEETAAPYRLRGRSVVILVSALAVVVACILVLMLFMHGDFSLVKQV